MILTQTATACSRIVAAITTGSTVGKDNAVLVRPSALLAALTHARTSTFGSVHLDNNRVGILGTFEVELTELYSSALGDGTDLEHALRLTNPYVSVHLSQSWY